MKKISILILTCLLSSTVFSQEAEPNNKIIHSWGWSAYTDITSTPRHVTTQWDPNAYAGYDSFGNPIYGKQVTTVTQDFGYSLLTVYYKFRYNIKEPNDDRSLGISATPALGFILTYEEGVGLFNLPFQLEYAFGAGSTYSSSADKGGYIGGGFEISRLPLIYDGEKTTWVQPVLSTGLRYWNRKNRMREVNLKFGFALGNDPAPSSNPNAGIILPPISLRLSWCYFIAY